MNARSILVLCISLVLVGSLSADTRFTGAIDEMWSNADNWSDGLPVVPPTPERVLRMLGGTERAPDEVVGTVAPNMAPCTVEKAAMYRCSWERKNRKL